MTTELLKLRELTILRGEHTSMITLILPANSQLAIASKLCV